MDPANRLVEFDGAEIVQIPVSRDGYIDLEKLEATLVDRKDEIALVSVMHSNNEVGSIQPIKQTSALAKRFDVPVHTDAVQSFGKTPLNFKELEVFAMTLSAHKIGGPVGVGALVLKKGNCHFGV